MSVDRSRAFGTLKCRICKPTRNHHYAQFIPHACEIFFVQIPCMSYIHFHINPNIDVQPSVQLGDNLNIDSMNIGCWMIHFPPSIQLQLLLRFWARFIYIDSGITFLINGGSTSELLCIHVYSFRYSGLAALIYLCMCWLSDCLATRDCLATSSYTETKCTQICFSRHPSNIGLNIRPFKFQLEKPSKHGVIVWLYEDPWSSSHSLSWNMCEDNMLMVILISKTSSLTRT